VIKRLGRCDMADDGAWTVLMCRDIDAAKRFYADVLGWTFEACTATPLPCWVASGRTGKSIATFIDTSESGFPDAPELWLPYLSVDDLEARIKAAEEHGATLLRPPFAIASFGRVAIIRQPGGGIVGWASAPSPG
jgi:predicted enzyme related to lactoylglutathione lyase